VNQASESPTFGGGAGSDVGTTGRPQYTTGNATAQLLAHLHRGGTCGYWWTNPGKTSHWWAVGDPLPIPQGRHDVYFGVHPTNEIPSTNAKGKVAPPDKVRSQTAYISAINTLFGEFDAKHFGGDKAAALAYVDALRPAPSVVVDSGGGFHCYWLLAEPFALTDDAKRERARDIQARWVAFVGSDDDAKDLARVLRVPGTRNYKPAYGPDFPTVVVIRADFDRLYDLDALERLLPAKAQTAKRDNGRGDLKTLAHSDIVQRQKHWTHALETAARMVQSTVDGDKHATLLRAARLLGGYLAGGVGNEQEAIALLEIEIDKCPNVVSMDAARDTIRDGLAYGKGKPITFEELERERLDWLAQRAGKRQEALPGEETSATPPEPDVETSATAEHATRDADGALRWDSKKAPATFNYIAALNSLGYHFRMNECNDRTEINSTPISDALRAKIRSQMRDLGYRHVNVMEDAWVGHAYDNRFHPVRDFLGDLTWDGADHIGALASYFTDTNGYLQTFLQRWLIGAVARAYELRSCQNRMLVLDAGQGMRKSYFVRWLASPLTRPELFVEGPVNPDDKDDLLRLITAWVWEVSEVGSTTRRSDREALKYFLSMQQVTVRKPYGREDLIKPALASFIGTVNDVAGFLDDPTGYRRFMAVHLDAIDWAYSDAVAPAEVWAQAKALYDKGEPWELTAQEAECAKFANEEYEVADPLEDILLRHYSLTGDGGDFTATVDIRDTLNGHGWRLGTPRGEAMAIGGVLKRLGLQVTRRTVRGNRERGFAGVKESNTPVNL